MVHYIGVQPGDQVWIDLGGYGMVVKLDGRKKWYDAEYVGFDYYREGVTPYIIPADMVISKGLRRTRVRQAESVRVWRHSS